MKSDELYWKSITFGGGVGLIFGALVGGITGALSLRFSGVMFGAIAGGLLGLVSGACTGALAVRMAGTTGGVSIGAYTGLVFGGLFGGAVGILIPNSLRSAVITLGIPTLRVMFQGRLEAALLVSFLVCIVCMIVGAWVAGRNLTRQNTAS